MADYWELYKRVKAFYFSIGRLVCPALGGEEIVFDSTGFRHMMNKNHHKRSIPDQIRRFKLLLHIKEILPNAQLDKSNRDDFYRLIGHYGKQKVRIVVAPIKEGGKHFISTM